MTSPIGISEDQLRAYLVRHGWQEVGSGSQGSSFGLPDRDDAPAILIPDEADDRDREELLASAVARLAWVQGDSEQSVLGAILRTSDVLEIRVMDPTTSSGRIALERGVHVAECMRQIIYNGARVHFSGPRAGYRGGLSEDARAVVDRLELAPPTAGSFKLEVYAPPDPQLAFEVGDDAPDPAHETLVSTLRAVAAAKDAVEQPDLPEDVEDLGPAIREGVSTNLMNAMLKLKSTSPQIQVEFRGRWRSPDADAPEAVVIEYRHFERFSALHDVLAQSVPLEDYPLLGWIKAVSADALAVDEQPLTGWVIVEARIDRALRDVKVELHGDDLRQAASGVGEMFLSALGTLEKVRREWHLVEPRGVSIRETRPADLDE